MKRFLRIFILAIMKFLTPIIGLRLLLHMDNWLYYLQGQAAIRYEGGIHPKHRLTKYHDFFVGHIGEGERVLDLGCGNGAVAYDIADKSGAFVVGIDKNPEIIKNAKKLYNHPNVKFVCGDITKGISNNDYDVIILSNVLEHLEDRPNLLKRLVSIINPSRFLIRVPLFERDWRVPLKKELGVEWRLDPTHEIEYTLETFTQEIQKAGLIIHYMEIRWGEIWAEVWPLK